MGILLLGAPPSGKKGQVNLNIFGSAFDFPFVNMAKTFGTFAASDAPTQDCLALLTADGYPTAIPSGSARWSSNGTLYYPGGWATFTGSVSGTTLTVSSAVTGDALAVGRTIRGTGITAGTRIVSGSGSVWTLNQSMTAASTTVTASIPWVLDWTGTATLSFGIAQQILKSLTTVAIGSNRIEVHMEPYPGAVVNASLSGHQMDVTSFVSGDSVPTFYGRASGVGMPPFSGPNGGTGGTGIVNVVDVSGGGLRELSYTKTGQFTIEPTVFGTPIVAGINITSITTTPGNIRVYRQDQEALLATQLCAPHFISYYSQYGRIRFLNWMQTNGNMQAQWIQRPQTSQFTYAAGATCVVPAIYGGIATKVSKNDYSASGAISYTDSSGVTQNDPSTWTDGMMLQTQVAALPTLKAVTGMLWTGSATKVTSVGHGFTTGDVVFFTIGEFSGGTWNGQINYGPLNGLLAKCIYTVTVLNVDEFTLDGINSSTWGTYTGGGHVGWAIRFKSGALPYKTIVEHDTLTSPFKSNIDALWINPLNQSLISLVYNASLDVLIMQHPDNTGRGIPIEIACQVCNECGADAWVSVPMKATDNFVSQMATTIKATMLPSVKWCFELSNEVWNTAPGFDQSNYAIYVAYAQFEFTNTGTAMYEWYAYRFGQMVDLINVVYNGDDHSKCTRILGFKTDDGNFPVTFDWRTKAPTIAPPVWPGDQADEFCCATYFAGDFLTDAAAAEAIGNYQQGIITGSAALVTSSLNACDVAFKAGAEDFCISRWAGIKGLAHSFGVAMSAYEGGFSVTPDYWKGGAFFPISPSSYLGIPFNALDQLNMWTGYQLSAQYGATYTALLNSWRSGGGIQASQFQSTGFQPSGGSMWAARYPNIFGDTNPGEIAFNAYNAS